MWGGGGYQDMIVETQVSLLPRTQNGKCHLTHPLKCSDTVPRLFSCFFSPWDLSANPGGLEQGGRLNIEWGMDLVPWPRQ